MEIHNKLANQFGKSRCCHERVTFVVFCAKVASKFSAQYCKTLILSPLVEMTNEIVSSVLFCLCQNIKGIRLAINPKDLKLIKKLELLLEEHIKSFPRNKYLKKTLTTALSEIKSNQLKFE